MGVSAYYILLAIATSERTNDYDEVLKSRMDPGAAMAIAAAGRLPDHHQSTFERFSVTMSLLTVVAIYLLKLMIILMVHGDSTHRRRGGGGGASVEMLAWKFWVVDSMYLPCHGVKLSVIFFSFIPEYIKNKIQY